MYGSFGGRISSDDDNSDIEDESHRRMSTIKLVPIRIAEDETDGNEDEDEDATSDDLIMGKNSIGPAAASEKDEKETKDSKFGILDGIFKRKDIVPSEEGSVLSDETSVDFSLHQAAGEGAIDRVKQIITDINNRGGDLLREIDRQNTQGFTPLHLAARYNRKNVISFLLDNGAGRDIQGGEDNYTPLHLATKYNMASAAKCLIQAGVDATLKNKYGSTALHFAARRGNPDICQQLLDLPDVIANVFDNGLITPLHAAMLGGSVEVTKLLIENGVNVNAENIEGERPIHFAAAEDQGDLIVLLAKGALVNVSEEDRENAQRNFVNATSHERDTALHVAAQAGYDATVKTLISIGADVNVRTDTRSTPLHLAAISGQTSVVKFLVMHEARINATDDEQMTPLHKACQYGKLETVKYLQEHGARLDAKDKDNFTPLMCAVWKGQNEVVEYLIDNKARMNLTDMNMKTVLQLAIEENHTDTLELLIQKGAGNLVNITDKDYRTPLHYAATSGNDQAIALLLSKSAQVDNGDSEEKTPVHIAAACGKIKCVKLLGEKAAGSINSTDERGRSPLHLAAMNGHVNVCGSLIEMGAETSCRDDVNWTPLDYAAQNGYPKTVRVLLENDALVDACDKNYTSPLHHASANGHVECIQMLLDFDASISHLDNNGKNCLDLAVENYQRDACMAFITHKRWKEALRHVDNDGTHPMEKLIAMAPDVAEVVLNNSIHYSKHPKRHKDYHITYNFDFLDLHPDDQVNKTYFGPSNMVQFQRESLLSHPVTVMLVNDKWARLGRWIYLLSLSFYILFVALLTSLLVIDKRRGKNAKKNVFQEAVPWCTLFLAAFQICKEVTQLFYLRRHYFQDMENYLEIILYTSTILFMSPFIAENLDSILSDMTYSTVLSVDKADFLDYLEDVKWNAGAVSILLAWGNLLLYLKRFPFFGIHVVMFIEVLKTVLSVLVVFSIFIVAFGLAFFVLMDGQDAFKYVGRSVIKTAVMTIGEFEYESVFTANLKIPKALPYQEMSYLVFILFLIIMPIIIMNLLVGLAIGDIEAVRKSAYIRILRAQVHILKTLEKTYPKWILNRVYRNEVIFYPNGRSLFQRFLDWLGTYNYDSLKEDQFQIVGKEQLIMSELTNHRKEIEKQKKRLKSVIQMLEDQFETTRRIAEQLDIEDD